MILIVLGLTYVDCKSVDACVCVIIDYTVVCAFTDLRLYVVCIGVACKYECCVHILVC